MMVTPHSRICWEKVARPVARREAVVYLRQVFEMSERRACRVIDTDGMINHFQVKVHGLLSPLHAFDPIR